MYGTLSVLLLIMSQAAVAQGSSSKAPWLCRTYSGKGERTITVRDAHALSWFANHLGDFDSETAWVVKHESGWDSIKAVVTSVGKFHRRDVVQILFTIPGKPSPVGKLVLVGDPGQFRPVIWILAETEIEFSPPAIVQVSGTTVLVNRDWIPGTGNFYFEDYFVFDDDSEIPVSLRFDEGISSELKKLLPPGRAVRKGGGFHIESLHYTQGVWKEGDPNCCPSAGKVDIQFAIKDNAAVVVSAAYDPAYKWRQ